MRTAYREEVRARGVRGDLGARTTTFHLNVSKTKELIVDFRRRQREEHAPLSINGTTVERVNSFRCTIERILTGCIITAWYSSCTALNHKALQRVVKAAQHITRTELPSMEDLYTQRCRKKATKIIKDPSHPSYKLFCLLPSGNADDKNVDSVEVTEELLTVIPMYGQTTTQEIFRQLCDAIENAGLPWKRFVGITTDRAPSMTGRKNGLVPLLEDPFTFDVQDAPPTCFKWSSLTCSATLTLKAKLRELTSQVLPHSLEVFGLWLTSLWPPQGSHLPALSQDSTILVESECHADIIALHAGGLDHHIFQHKPSSAESFQKHQRDLIVQRYQSGEGYKRISKELNIPWNTVKTVIIKWRKYGTTVTLPRTGRPSKIDDKTRRKLVREAAKRPTVQHNEGVAGSFWQVLAVCSTCDNNLPSSSYVWAMGKGGNTEALSLEEKHPSPAS
ncbi:hypothetical protein L3Q82_013010 [Scortum barcoo]|uniref:Uncharacterized protein n=1 Tax=Scortum barcoo TaxID=214431 RepID=A0ACB8VYW2_9TELE|nr:hypothetical protein L3Q82_013010 [Scortum barcoo]